MMSLHHFIAIALATSSLAMAQDSPIPTKLLSNPVEPTAFSDDPALSTHRPLVIVTASESVSSDQGEQTSSVVLSLPETSTTQENTFWVQTTMPTPSQSGLFPQTTFPNSTATTTTTAAETSSSSSSSSRATTTSSSSSSASLTTLTGTQTSLTSNPASVPTAFANAAAGLIALVGFAMAL